MSSSYFSNIPLIEYDGQNLINLMINSRMTQEVLTTTAAFYPYTLQDGDTPTTIAAKYYGSIQYVWLVYFSNNIIDPVSQWYKSAENFDLYMIDLYGDLETATSTVLYYSSADDETYPTVTPTTYSFMTNEQRMGFVPIYAYDFYHQVNQNRKTIRLVDDSFASTIALELEKSLLS